MLLPNPKSITFHPGRHAVPSSRGVRGWDPGTASPTIERSLGLSGVHPDIAPWIRWTSAATDQGTDSGSYSLQVTTGPTIEIQGTSVRGLRHALATLAQLVRRHGDSIPCCEIRDEPAFSARGVMIDVSRDRVPTMSQLLETIDLMAALKFNHLQLYTEHTFAYAGHETVWRGWSPLTPDEIRRLDAYCIARGIELAANQNCFGHMVPWLRHERYAHLAETHGDWMFDIWPRSGPFSLCPTDPASLDLVEDLLGQLAPCFSSPHINIGCDEVYDIAYGRSREEVARRGRAAVYMEFVNRIAALCRPHGKRAQFWGDIALSHPECIKDIPADVIPLAWGYEPDSPFEQWGQTLAAWQNSLRSDGPTMPEFWVCPGTSTWRSLTGRTTERRGNVSAAARSGLKHGAAGILTCDWGDSGHHQQWPIVMHALADASQAAWNPGEACDPAAESLHLFGDPTGDTARWLDRLGDADLPLREVCGALSHPTRTRLLNQTAIFIDLFKQLGEQTEVGDPNDWALAHEALLSCAKSVPPGVSPLIADELRHTADYAVFAAWRGWSRRRGGADLSRGPDRVRRLAHDHARLWRIRSREGGLEHSLSFFQQVFDTFVAKDGHGRTMFE